MKTLLRDFNEKVGREEVLKSTLGSKSFQEISHNNWVRV